MMQFIKCVNVISTVAIELFLLVWFIYGHRLYFSPESGNCSDSNAFLIILIHPSQIRQFYYLFSKIPSKLVLYVMLLVIIIFYLKFSVYLCVIGALLGYVVIHYRRKRNAINQSEVILKSLVKTKFGQMVLNQAPARLAEEVIMLGNDEQNPE